MELWNIKADALRLMFADTDIMFNKEEFENNSLYENSNTREKLIRMNDSIRRAIDLYYHYAGQYKRRATVKYVVDNQGKVTNFLDLSQVEDFGIPSRIQLYSVGENTRILNFSRTRNLSFYYDAISGEVSVEFDLEGSNFDLNNLPRGIKKEDFEFLIYYEVKKMNLPSDEIIDELTFDLNTLNIPEDIQRMIPKYIKGEIYEEDEYSIALMSKEEYMRYLIEHVSKFSNVQTRVRSNYRRG